MKTQYKSLRINYEERVELELDAVWEELNITVEDIRAITVNYNVLTIKTFDDKTLIYEFDSILFGEDIKTVVLILWCWWKTKAMSIYMAMIRLDYTDSNVGL